MLYDKKAIIRKALLESKLEKDEIIELLAVKNKEDLESLFLAAREIRNQHFSNKVFLYGFVYFSTWCKNECNFCYYRHSNDIMRYRKSPEEILEIAKNLADSGVHLIDLTMGEDIKYHQENYESILKVIKDIKETTQLPVMISPGVVENKVIDQLANMGTEWYALYQETHNRALFSQLRTGQDYDERMHAKEYAKEKGMRIEEGILVGVGENLEDIANSILEMGRINAKQVRVMGFVPQKGSPMENRETSDRELELKVIAILRLMYPNALIPASLDVDGIWGLKARMNAGANVITSIIPPKQGLMGVAQSVKDVEEGSRTVKEVQAILSQMGLIPATVSEYMDYLGRHI